MIFRQMFEAARGLLCYLIADPVTRQAVVIDPLPSLLPQLHELEVRLGLTLVYVLETHGHKDYASAALDLKCSTGARVVAHEAATNGPVDLRARDGDVLYFGEETIRVLHIPGQSPCAVTYWWKDRLFTGETLLAGGIPGCGYLGGDHRTRYQTVISRLLTFPGETLVYPGRESRGRRLVSIEELRRHGNGFNGEPGRQVLLLAYRKLRLEETGKEKGNSIRVQEDDVHHYMPGRDVSASS